MRLKLPGFESFKTVIGKISQGRLLIVGSGLLMTFLAAALYIFQPQYLRLQDNKIYDALLRSSHNAEHTGVPVIVDIDESSLDRFGQWPWPRYRIALLIEKIRRLGALAVGLDVLFAEPDRTSPNVLQEELKGLNVNIEFVNLPPALRDNDQVLANILAKGPFVLGYNFLFEGEKRSGNTCALHPLNIVILKAPNTPPETPFPYKATDVVCNLESLSKAAPASGFITTGADPDSILRRTPLLMGFDGKIYPSLSLATLIQATQTKQINLKLGPYGAESMRIGPTVIPLDAKGGLLVHYRGKHNTFTYISAGDILQDRLPKTALKGKIAFVGTSASGLKDIRATPFDQSFPGVEIHATVVDNILKQDFLSRPHWAKGLEMLLVIACGVVSTLLLAWTHAGLSLVALCLGALGLWQGAVWSLDAKGFYISPLLPMVSLGCNFSVLTLLKYWREESEKKFFHSAFSRYVSKSVMDQIVTSRDKLSLTGEEKNVTILFSDIRDFTSISEKLSSQQVSELLGAYFTPMTHQIIEHKGTLDKFIGDAIMAFWNAPLDISNHQRRAIQAALDMFTTLDRLNNDFRDQFGFEIRIGIGLHYGGVRVGNMGSQDLFDYTIVGDSVNLASRLEGLTKVYGLELLVSEAVKQACEGDFRFLEIDKVTVKGKTRPVTLFTAFSTEKGESYQAEFSAYLNALGLYRDQQFREAQGEFSRIQKDFRQIKLYQLYQDRCANLVENPPGPGWDQVYAFKVK